MKNLIENIAINNQLKSLELNDGKLNPTLLYFENKDDFYILIYSEYKNLLHQLELNESGDHLDLGINAYLDTIKEYSDTASFNSRFIDFNLSCIIAIELDTFDNKDILKNIHKIEEDYKIAKKYILPYVNSDFELLHSKIEKISYENLNEKLNSLALQNSNVINDKEEMWYKLLMNLFIKLPFLNYHSSSFGLSPISELLEEELSEDEKNILKIIEDNYSDSVDVESFISQFKISDDE
ncbi:hypothetical protein [Chryseobacterium sp. CFBP8996]|uniref:hypothetical protein n=1 Tax=Chryseobacterium sp. CFBP8996 TaxID=3096529 RepID=UPI002A6AFF91|nr:hypothetical protein [Chryseobacterium sp. CFBP8996]MDY0931623.1 hypothetical protein [Chryseobacterium sp. CFBP8996]